MPADKVLEGEGFKVVVDAIALSYLKGCDIDFTQDGLNASFVFNNVFQTVGGSGTCGACGAAGGAVAADTPWLPALTGYIPPCRISPVSW